MRLRICVGLLLLAGYAQAIATPIVLEATGMGLSHALVHWKKVPGASSYEVAFSTTPDPNQGAELIQVNFKNSCEVTNLKNRTLYYFWVRALGQDLEKSEWSQMTAARTFGYEPAKFQNEVMHWKHSLVFHDGSVGRELFHWQTNIPGREWSALENGVSPARKSPDAYYSLNAGLYSAVGNFYVEAEVTILAAEGNGVGFHLGGHRSVLWDYHGRNHLILDPVKQKVTIGSVTKDSNTLNTISATAPFACELGKTYKVRFAWDDADHRLRAHIDGVEVLKTGYSVVGNAIWSTGMVVLGNTPVRFSNFSIRAFLPTNGDGTHRDIAAHGDSITHGRLWVTNFEGAIKRRITSLGISLDTGANIWNQGRFQLDLSCLAVKKIILFHGANDLSVGGNFAANSPQVDVTLGYSRNMALWCLSNNLVPVLAEVLPRSDVKKGEAPVGRASHFSYNQKLNALAEEHKIPILRWYQSLLDPDSPFGMMPGMHDGGWIHPNSVGAPRMIQGIDLNLFQK